MDVLKKQEIRELVFKMGLVMVMVPDERHVMFMDFLKLNINFCIMLRCRLFID